MIYGFPQTATSRPTRYVGRNHTYVFFPVSWSDSSTGKMYSAGYYDENGEKYDNLAFAEEDGSYKNVLCECEYCGTRKIMDVDTSGTLQCEACGGTMKIVSTVDELVRKETIDSSYTSAYDTGNANTPVKKGLTVAFIAIFAAAIIFIISVFSFIRNAASTPVVTHNTWDSSFDSNVVPITESYEDYDYSVFLKKTADGIYSEVDSSTGYDKELIWDDSSESYYDAETDCYLWYNEELYPPIWQYWYEGISSDFGDYGWMEYDDDEQKWYIEQDYNDWIELPSQYNTSRLWHIE